MHRTMIVVATACLVGVCGGCQHPARSRYEPIEPRAVAPPAAGPASAPGATRTTVPPAAGPTRPSFVVVLERMDPARGQQLQTVVVGSRRVQLTTRNVRRLSITRRRGPLAREGSIVLRIDTQVFEWIGRFDTLELTRSENGIWRITRRWPPGP